MPEIRSVSVHLDADVAGYIAKMKLAGAATDQAFSGADRRISSTSTSLGDVDRSATRADTSLRKLGTTLDGNRVKVDTGAKAIDRYSGRLGVFADLALGLGPALIPIGATVVPAVIAIGTGFVGAAAGAGVAKLAFMGVGTALKAVNKYDLEPTAENLKAARDELSKLSPEARRFTLYLQSLKPTLQDLRDLSARGLMPGAEDGLRALMSDLPVVRRDIGLISTELGNLARETGDSLSSERWRPFLRFIGDEGPIALGTITHALGGFGHGIVELMMAFTPATHDLDAGIIRLADDFDRWASSVGRTRGFQDFLAYLDANGPRVVDLLGNTATTLLDIAEAAAPLGGPILDTLNVFLNVLDAIANSDLGTPIFTGLVAIRLMSRATQLWGTVSGTAAGQFVAGQKAAVLAIRQTIAMQRAGVASTEQLALAQSRSTAGWATLRGGALKAGAGVAGFGLLASGAADKIHLQNTATLALAGSMFGPWGTAIGAGAGLLLDFTHHEDNSAAATVDFTSTLNQQTGAITGNTRALAAQTLQQDGALDAAEKLGISTALVVDATLGNAAAQAQLQAQLDTFTGVTQPGYIAGGRGMNSINQDMALTAGKLGTEVGVVGDKVSGSQADFRQLKDATDGTSHAADRAARSQHRLAVQLQADQDAAREAGKRFLAFGDNLDDAKVSLDRWIHSLATQARDLHQFAQNARDAADRGLRKGLIAALQDAGPEGARRMRQLANASKSEIARANSAWLDGQRGLDDLADAAAYVSQHPAKVHVLGVTESVNDLQRLSSALNALHDKTINVTTRHFTGGRSVAGDADGGTIPGPRQPYGDKVLRFVAPGEEVISNRHGQADRHRQLLKAINSGRMADGGTVDTHVTRTGGTVFAGNSGLGAAARNAGDALKGLQGRSKDLQKTLADERAQRQALIQQRQELTSTVRDNFATDVFGVVPDDPWASGATSDPRTLLRQQIRDAREFRDDIRKLRRRGLSGRAIREIDTLADAEQAMGLSRRELHQISRLEQVRDRAARAAGIQLGDAVVGRRLAAIHDELRGTNHRLDKVEAAVKHHEKSQQDHPKKTGDAAGAAVNGAVRNGVRRQKPW